MAITPVAPAAAPGLAPAPVRPAGVDSAKDGGFGDALRDLIGKVEGTSSEANDAVGRMLNGTGDVHEAMIALQRADTMLQLTVQVRNKLVQAYQDTMRMPV
jgi:flagellar hook-basal body complex protein FliE